MYCYDNAECHHAGRRYAEYHYTDSRGTSKLTRITALLN